MTYVVKGFVEVNSLAKNGTKATSVIGEMTNLVRCFTTDLRIYTDDANYPDLNFNLLDSKNDEVVEDMPETILPKIFSVTDALLGSLTETGDAEEIITADTSLTSVVVGETATDTDADGTAKYLPTYVEFTFTDANSEIIKVHLYYSNTYIRTGTNYDSWEAKIVPPLEDIDNLIASYATVSTRIANMTEGRKSDLESSIIDGEPYSHKRPYTLRWTDPNNASNTISTTWYVIGYGPKSIEAANMINAISDYIAANSSTPLTTWATYFPDLDISTNFTFIPKWTSISVSAGNGVDAYFRPTLKLSEIASIVTTNLNAYTDAQVQSLAEVIVGPYRSIPIVVVPGTANDESNQSFEAMYSDYTIVYSSTGSISDSLTTVTKNLLAMLERLLRAAYDYEDGTSLESDLQVETVDSKRYISGSSDGMSLRVLVRADYA